MNYAEQLSNIIKNHDLYGRSFTLGVALYIGITRDEISFSFAEEFEELCSEYYYDLYKELSDKYGMHSGAKVWAEMLDLAVLDEMARELTGEEEDEE